jgi:hypothetical protein
MEISGPLQRLEPCAAPIFRKMISFDGKGCSWTSACSLLGMLA